MNDPHSELPDMNGIKLTAACLAALLLQAQPAWAQGYPNRAIRFVIPTAPGGGPDVVARMLQPELTQALGQTIVVDNRAGANALIGADVVAKAPPDGYTWLMATGQNTMNANLVRKMPHDIVKDFAPVTNLIKSPYLLVVHPSLPAKSVSDLIALAKSRPGKLNFGSGGVGSAAHLSAELFKVSTNVNMVHVVYKGAGLALSDLVAGHIDLMFPAIASGIPHHKAGALRGLGVTGPRRHPSLPEMPTIAEAGVPGYELRSWFGLMMPAGTPRAIVDQVNAVMRKVMALPHIRDRLIAQGTDPETDTPEEFARFIRDDVVKQAKVARAAGLKPE